MPTTASNDSPPKPIVPAAFFRASGVTAEPATISYTVEDLLTLELPPGVAHFELSDGELIPVGNAGSRHEIVKAKLNLLLVTCCLSHPDFHAMMESSFKLGPSTSRQPDGAVITREKYQALPFDDVPIAFAPDFAVEVVSASESASDADRKVREYLAAGTSEIWQIQLNTRRLSVHRPGAEAVEFSGSERAHSTVLPGFSATPDAFFNR